MAEKDPRDYRGGVHEPADAKGGADSGADTEGVVPREMIDEPGAAGDEPGEQGLSGDVLGQVTGREEDAIDTSGGDEADATRGETGANVEDAKHEVAEGEPTAWPESAGAAPADTGGAG